MDRKQYDQTSVYMQPTFRPMWDHQHSLGLYESAKPAQPSWIGFEHLFLGHLAKIIAFGLIKLGPIYAFRGPIMASS